MFAFASRAGRWPLALSLAAAALAAPVTGCVSATRHSETAATVSATSLRSAPSLSPATSGTLSARRRIGPAELASVEAGTAYELVSLLRPEFLRSSRRSAGEPTPPDVYVDGVIVGPPSALADIPADAVVEVRYVHWLEAFSLVGPRHAAGMILVRTRR